MALPAVNTRPEVTPYCFQSLTLFYTLFSKGFLILVQNVRALGHATTEDKRFCFFNFINNMDMI